MALFRAMLLCSYNLMTMSHGSTTGSCSQMKVGLSTFLQWWVKNTIEGKTNWWVTDNTKGGQKHDQFLPTYLEVSAITTFCFVLLCILDGPQINQVDFELLILLSPLPKCWDHRHKPLSPVLGAGLDQDFMHDKWTLYALWHIASPQIHYGRSGHLGQVRDTMVQHRSEL